MPKKQRAARVADLNALPPNAQHVLLSTGKLVLAMPVAWKGTQSISTETALDQVADYQTKKGGRSELRIGQWQQHFYSGFETTVADAGSGNDRFHIYLGDVGMAINSGSSADKLYIHTDASEYAGFGMNTNIGLSDLYYQASTKTLSIFRNNVNYGKTYLNDWHSNDTISLLTKCGASFNVLLSSLQVLTQTSTQY